MEIELYRQKYKLKSMEIERPRITYTWVRLYGYPLDAELSFVEKTMRMYGELVTLTDDIDGRLQIKTVVKIAQFSSLKGNIPSFVHIGRHRVRTAYRGQTKTCRNCHQVGHEVKDCTAGRVCKQCGKPGHTKGECPERICFQCLGKGHEVINCPEYNNAFPRLGEDENGTEKENAKETGNGNEKENELTFDPPADNAWQTAAEREQAMNTDEWQTPEEGMETQRRENTSETHETGNSTPSTNEVNKNTLSDNSKESDPKELSTTHMVRDPMTDTTAPKIDNPGGGAFSPPPQPDTTDPSSDDEEEPPLKTSKTTKPTTKVDNGVGELEQEQEQEAGKTTTAKAQGKKAKKKKGRNPAVNVSGGKIGAPFFNKHTSV